LYAQCADLAAFYRCQAVPCWWGLGGCYYHAE